MELGECRVLCDTKGLEGEEGDGGWEMHGCCCWVVGGGC